MFVVAQIANGDALSLCPSVPISVLMPLFRARLYLDASAFREKHVKPTFVSRYVFPGDHSYFCLHDFLAAVAKTHLDVSAVLDDRHNYYLTCKAWAENLEAAREEITRRWGEALYRRFQLYLWGSAYAFLNRGMEAYRVVLERPRDA